MYVENDPILVSRIMAGEEIFARWELWPSNGTYVRTPEGKRFDCVATKETRVRYLVETDYGKHLGVISDKLIVSRIVEYMGCYYNKKHTNCSAFAHFLMTGTFVECNPELRCLVIEQGMRVYDGQKIGIGDMVCIYYSRTRKARSRKNNWRSDYVKIQKGRYEDGCFGHSLAVNQQTFTAKQIRDIHDDYHVDDFHFMVCVAIREGEPVFVSQRGRFEPGEACTPLVLTVGTHDCYCDDVPLLSLIKKRR